MDLKSKGQPQPTNPVTPIEYIVIIRDGTKRFLGLPH